ncbi:hypothetical protein HPB47_001972 [Ixodes persulcatus]|uniref:Uncharacterized protein n=1 Tax=Ixodes persulcatus TaxID=34615 RepID=A0AC60PMW8_IXOPE|nr:hypothetical protein HPB47_001972 [Ixodes persulcatus]
MCAPLTSSSTGGSSLGIYTYKVLELFHPDTDASSGAMLTMNSFMNDAFEHIEAEVSCRGPLQALNHHEPREPDGCAAAAAGRAG